MMMKWIVVAAIPTMLFGCNPQVVKDDALATLKSHEQFANAGDLDGVMSNMDDDLVVLFPNTPMIIGKDAFKTFYGGLLSIGTYSMVHDVTGNDAAGDTAILYGKNHGTVTPPGGPAIPFSNNFIATFRYDKAGKMKFWRASFAPDAP
jgi:ketosteroid isomerase-like protein